MRPLTRRGGSCIPGFDRDHETPHSASVALVLTIRFICQVPSHPTHGHTDTQTHGHTQPSPFSPSTNAFSIQPNLGVGWEEKPNVFQPQSSDGVVLTTRTKDLFYFFSFFFFFPECLKGVGKPEGTVALFSAQWSLARIHPQLNKASFLVLAKFSKSGQPNTHPNSPLDPTPVFLLRAF